MATSESTRARRFALPDLKDERGGESIEAFLEGPKVRRHRPKVRAVALTSDGPTNVARPLADEHSSVRARPSMDLRTIPGRLEWNAALERESARAARYGRPAAVAIVELRPDRANLAIDPWLRIVAGPVARALRAGSRATDLVARVASTRFQILMPETPESGAGRFADRVSSVCRASIEASGAPVTVRVSVAAATADHTLHEALAHALRSLEAA
jgi:GGDEF domain-containing protein